MDWFSYPVVRLPNGDRHVTVGPTWLAIPADLRGHHAALMSVCASQENGGLFTDSIAWSDRQWDRLAGVTRRDLDRMAERGLVSWEENHLRVSMYDPGQEKKARVRAEKARQAGIASGEARRWDESTPSSTTSSTPSSTTGSATSSTSSSTPSRTEEIRKKRDPEDLSPQTPQPKKPAVGSNQDFRNAFDPRYRTKYGADCSWRPFDYRDGLQVLMDLGIREVEARIVRAFAMSDDDLWAAVNPTWNGPRPPGKPAPRITPSLFIQHVNAFAADAVASRSSGTVVLAPPPAPGEKPGDGWAVDPEFARQSREDRDAYEAELRAQAKVHRARREAEAADRLAAERAKP